MSLHKLAWGTAFLASAALALGGCVNSDVTGPCSDAGECLSGFICVEGQCVALPDGSLPDAGPADTGPTDSGPSDATIPADATVDAGSSDAGDAGTDAGICAAGGTVCGPNNVCIDIPAGALNGCVVITVSEAGAPGAVPGVTTLSQAYSIEPKNAGLSKLVGVRIPLADPPAGVAIYRAPALAGPWTKLPSITSNGNVGGQTDVLGMFMIGGPPQMPDAGPADTGVVDAGPVDSGPADAGVDSGPADSGPIDTGPEADAGPADTGPVDTGPVDTGPVDTRPELDAGPADTGPVDSGPELDAGPADTGPELDAGPADTGPADAGVEDSGTIMLPDANFGPPDVIIPPLDASLLDVGDFDSGPDDAQPALDAGPAVDAEPPDAGPSAPDADVPDVGTILDATIDDLGGLLPDTGI